MREDGPVSSSDAFGSVEVQQLQQSIALQDSAKGEGEGGEHRRNTKGSSTKRTKACGIVDHLLCTKRVPPRHGHSKYVFEYTIRSMATSKLDVWGLQYTVWIDETQL